MLLRFGCLFITIWVLETSARYVQKPCEPSSVFKIDCNTCHCALNGLRYTCTLMNCFNTVQDDYPLDLFRQKRDLGDYNDPNQDFLADDDPIPFEESQRLELLEQQQLLAQQVAEDKRRERLELAAQQRELKQQDQEMKKQLEYQEAMDELQRTFDEAQQDLDSQQAEIDRQEALYNFQQESGLESQNPNQFKTNKYY